MSGQLNIAQTLLVSQLELSFSPTEVGEEQFLLLKIGQQGTNTPIQMRIEGTDSFQIAVQGSPLRFYSQLSFVPAPGGTYVHVQFMPKETGHHITELLIETAYGTQPVSLSGRTIGLLGRRLTPSSQRQRETATSDRVAQPAHEAITGSPWLKILVLVAFLGGGGALAYWWYMNRAAPLASPPAVITKTTPAKPAPKLQKTIAVQPETGPVNPLIDKPLSEKLTPKTDPATPVVTRRTRVVEPVVTASEPDRVVTKRIESTPPPVRSPRVSAAPAAKPANPTEAETTRLTASRPGTAPVVADKRIAADKVSKSKKRIVAPAPRPKPIDVPTIESDLERTLNKNQ